MSQLSAVDGAVEYNFGRSVAVSKDESTIMVGASGNDFNTTITYSGAAYLFRITNLDNNYDVGDNDYRIYTNGKICCG
jgi:hypothetical protein